MFYAVKINNRIICPWGDLSVKGDAFQFPVEVSEREGKQIANKRQNRDGRSYRVYTYTDGRVYCERTDG